jgi:hypothetical protein
MDVYLLSELPVILWKKKLDPPVASRPQGISTKKETSRRPRKTPKPRPRPDTGKRNPWDAAWAIHGPQDDLGRLLTSALAHGTGEGIFFNPQPEIRSHWESNSGPGGCRRSARPTGLASFGDVFYA